MPDKAIQKLDKAIQRVLSEVNESLSRVLTAKMLTRNGDEPRQVASEVRENGSKILKNLLNTRDDGMDMLNYRFMAEALVDLRGILERINTGQVINNKRIGKPTLDIYENKLMSAISKIADTYGVRKRTDEIIADREHPPSEESSKLLFEIRKKADGIEARLKILLKPIRAWIQPSRIALVLCMAGFLAFPIFYSLKAITLRKHESAPIAIKTQIARDKVEINKTLKEPNKSSVERVVSATELISKATSHIPSILILLSLLLKMIHYLFIAQSWRGKNPLGISADLTAAAKSLK